jgi:hypothetical protein
MSCVSSVMLAVNTFPVWPLPVGVKTIFLLSTDFILPSQLAIWAPSTFWYGDDAVLISGTAERFLDPSCLPKKKLATAMMMTTPLNIPAPISAGFCLALVGNLLEAGSLDILGKNVLKLEYKNYFSNLIIAVIDVFVKLSEKIFFQQAKIKIYIIK